MAQVKHADLTIYQNKQNAIIVNWQDGDGNDLDLSGFDSVGAVVLKDYDRDSADSTLTVSTTSSQSTITLTKAQTDSTFTSGQYRIEWRMYYDAEKTNWEVYLVHDITLSDAFEGNVSLTSYNVAVGSSTTTVTVTSGLTGQELANIIDGVSAVTIADDDKFAVVDDTDTSLKSILWSAFKTAIKNWLDPLSTTFTNKTIDADNNTLSNLAHGSEVDNPSSGVHGVTGNVVGTSDTQTLTNKTITALSNTVYADQVHVIGDNETGVQIDKGTAVYASGYNVGQDEVEITKADATDSAKMPAIGIMFEDIEAGSTGAVTREGIIEGLDTSSYSVGDVLYVSETAGGLTSTKPTTSTSLIQPIAIVTRSNPGSGALQVIAVDAYKITASADGDIASKKYVDLRGEVVNALGSISGANAIDTEAGTVVTATLTAETTLTFSNPPSSGADRSFVLKFSGAETINWPVNTIFAGGSAPSITGPDYEIPCSIDSSGVVTVHGIIDEYATV